MFPSKQQLNILQHLEVGKRRPQSLQISGDSIWLPISKLFTDPIIAIAGHQSKIFD